MSAKKIFTGNSKNMHVQDAGRHIIKKKKSQSTTPIKERQGSSENLLQQEIHYAASQLLESPCKSERNAESASLKTPPVESCKKSIKFSNLKRKSDENLEVPAEMPERKKTPSTQTKSRSRSSPHPGSTAMESLDNNILSPSCRLSTPVKYFRSPVAMVTPNAKTLKQRETFSPKSDTTKRSTKHMFAVGQDGQRLDKTPKTPASILKTPKKISVETVDDRTPDVYRTVQFETPNSEKPSKLETMLHKLKRGESFLPRTPSKETLEIPSSNSQVWVTGYDFMEF